MPMASSIHWLTCIGRPGSEIRNQPNTPRCSGRFAQHGVLEFPVGGLWTHPDAHQGIEELDLLERLGLKTTAKIAGYEQAYDPDADCLVSFAALGLYLAD